MQKNSPKYSTRYIKRMVGGEGFFSFLRFELLTFFLKNLCGCLGVVLRSIFYKIIFKKIGSCVVFEQGVTIRCPDKIIIEEGCFIEHSSSIISASESKGIVFKNGTNIGIGSILHTYAEEGFIEIGEGTRIGHNVQILSHAKITIGKGCLIGGSSYISSSSHLFSDVNIPIAQQGFVAQEVGIGDDVWIGAHVTILSGVKIGRGSVIGAGAVVNKDIPQNSIAVGVPAKVIAKRGE